MINSASVVNIPFLQMKNGLDELVAGGTKYFHIDIMDGHYVPNLCMSIKYLKEKQYSSNSAEMKALIDGQTSKL